MICSACGAKNFEDARLCSQCSAALTARCPACAAEVQKAAKFCSACGHALDREAARGGPANDQSSRHAAGARKQVTILFGDFSGYTNFSARLDPEDLRDQMDTIWANLDAIIIAHGGTPEKHSGDGIMAIFGGHRSREEDPVEAVRAALAMQAWLKCRKSGSRNSELPMRIGINTGLVVVGPAEHTGEFLATGDSVNMASRLEQNSPVGGVLISAETYRHVFGFFDAQAMPLLMVKGKSEPVETFLILRAKARGLAWQMRGIPGVETALIGRRQELRRLQQQFRLAIQNHVPQIALVVGEAGIGKSRLFFEFHRKTELFPEYFRLFYGRATTEIAGVPFALLRDLFSTRFEIQESDPAAVAREKFERGLTKLLGTTAEADAGTRAALAQDIHFIGQLIGLDFSDSPHLREMFDDAAQIRQRAFQGFSRLLKAISECPATEHEPKYSAVLLVLEDLQWCDDGTLELLEHLVRHAQDLSLMVLASARPEFFDRHPGWCAGLPNVARLNLAALSDAESGTLVETILHKAKEIPPALKALVTDGAEGNPYYIEELIKMLIDQRVILPQAEQWQIEPSRLDNARVPSTLTGVLQVRLDGLSPTERWVLQRASVVGRVFWDSALEQMGSAENQKPFAGERFENAVTKDEISIALQDLRRKELVFLREASAFAGAAEYAFKHDLLRNVAYESLLKKSRRHYHARFAEWLKDRCGDRIREFASLIATHYEQAARLAEAAEWHGRAGQQARLGYSPAAAIIHFKKALQLLPAGGAPENLLLKNQLEWHEGLVETLGAQASFSEALDACNVVRRLAQQLRDPVAEARAWNDMAYLHERRGDNRASIECAEQAEAQALQSPAHGRAERIRALLFKGWAYYRLAEVSAVLELGGKVLDLCTELNDRRGTASSFKLLGVAHLQLGDYSKAAHFFEQGLALFTELGDQRNTAAMWSNCGETARACGDYEGATGLYEKALVIARQIGHRDSELIYLTNLSGARLGIRQFAQAETDLRQVIAQTSAPNSCVLAEAYTYLSEAALGQGKLSEAIRTAQKGISLAQESESPLYLGEAWRVLGRIGGAVAKLRREMISAEAGGELATTDPVHCFAESLRVFRQIKAAGEAARTLRVWAEHELQQGQPDPARKKIVEARNIFLSLGAMPEVATTETLLRAHGGE